MVRESLVLLVILILYPGVASDLCCGPDQWEASGVTTEGVVDMNGEYIAFTKSTTETYYDYTNKRLSSFENVWNITANSTYAQNMYVDYHTRIKWTVRETRCRRDVHWLPMTSPCIPDDAVHVAVGNVSDVAVDVWQWRDPIDGDTWEYTVSNDTCVQLIIMRVGQKVGSSFTLTVYNNISSGISDFRVFDVPSFCTFNMNVRWR